MGPLMSENEVAAANAKLVPSLFRETSTRGTHKSLISSDRDLLVKVTWAPVTALRGPRGYWLSMSQNPRPWSLACPPQVALSEYPSTLSTQLI